MDMPGGKTFRTIFYLPNVLAGVAAVFLWRWILAPKGLLNQGLAIFGIDGPAWFVDPQWTKPGLVVMGMWWIGGSVLIYLASLKGIPRSMYEAAEIDGATGWKSTWHITLPLLSPTIFFQVVTGIIGAFQIFSTALIIIGNDATRAGRATRCCSMCCICTTARSAAWARAAFRWATPLRWHGFCSPSSWPSPCSSCGLPGAGFTTKQIERADG